MVLYTMSRHTVVMAKRRALQPVKFQAELALGTLGNGTVISVATVAALEQDFDIISTDLSVSMRDHTAGEGPVEFGLAEQGYSVTEIAEALDASPLSQYGTAWERSKRKVRLYATFDGLLSEETVNDGLPLRKRMFLKAFAHSTFAAARVWVRNGSGAALTTGTVIEIQGTHWGRWK